MNECRAAAPAAAPIYIHTHAYNDASSNVRREALAAFCAASCPAAVCSHCCITASISSECTSCAGGRSCGGSSCWSCIAVPCGECPCACAPPGGGGSRPWCGECRRELDAGYRKAFASELLQREIESLNKQRSRSKKK